MMDCWWAEDTDPKHQWRCGGDDQFQVVVDHAPLSTYTAVQLCRMCVCHMFNKVLTYLLTYFTVIFLICVFSPSTLRFLPSKQAFCCIPLIQLLISSIVNRIVATASLLMSYYIAASTIFNRFVFFSNIKKICQLCCLKVSFTLVSVGATL